MSILKDEIDLHGKTVDEALVLVEKFLYDAFRARLKRVWVIHGKGTGVLRTEIRRYLNKHTLVRLYTQADGYRGGEGSTQVDLAD